MITLSEFYSIGFEIISTEKSALGETNDVYYCRAKYKGNEIDLYIKIVKNVDASLKHEYDILTKLKTSSIPVPDVVAYDKTKFKYLVLSKLPGSVIWDTIDPRRYLYNKTDSIKCLVNYGRCLGKIHSLCNFTGLQKRQKLYGFIGETEIHKNNRFIQTINWLNNNTNPNRSIVFTHGDFNTANVIMENNIVTGVVDWEFAGLGWKEYDIAWTLRARKTFINTDKEREAILNGYREYLEFDEKALNWCEVLNYLHFAFWDINNDPEYSDFALTKAEERMNS